MGFNFINQHSTSERHFEAEIFHSFCEITVKVLPLISYVIVDLILIIKAVKSWRLSTLKLSFYSILHHLKIVPHLIHVHISIKLVQYRVVCSINYDVI